MSEVKGDRVNHNNPHLRVGNKEGGEDVEQGQLFNVVVHTIVVHVFENLPSRDAWEEDEMGHREGE